MSLEETAANAYTAEVDGTELYVVDIQLDSQGTILDIACGCPYDMGEYCKHQAAVLLALRKLKTTAPGKDGNQAGSQPVKSGAKSAGRKVKKAPDIRQIFAARTKEELITFLIKLADEDESIGERLALDFGGGNDAEELRRAAKLIRACINRNADRRGFVDYKSAYAATEGARRVLDKARSQLQNHKLMQALALLLSVDDSDGFVGEEIDEAMRMIKEITQAEYLPSDDKAQTIWLQIWYSFKNIIFSLRRSKKADVPIGVFLSRVKGERRIRSGGGLLCIMSFTTCSFL